MMSRITLGLRKAGDLAKEEVGDLAKEEAGDLAKGDEDDPQYLQLPTIDFANTGMRRRFAVSSTPASTGPREDPDA